MARVLYSVFLTNGKELVFEPADSRNVRIKDLQDIIGNPNRKVPGDKVFIPVYAREVRGVSGGGYGKSLKPIARHDVNMREIMNISPYDHSGHETTIPSDGWE